MHLRIYLWLSCVVLAGYVRATEDGVAGAAPTVETAAPPQHDGPLSSDLDGFVDDEGSGANPDFDVSSGSGWGPGPDDEDSRGGSGDNDGNDPTRADDEDYIPAPKPAPIPEESPEEPFISVDSEEDVDKDNASTQAPFLPFDVDPRVISGKQQPIEEIDEPKKTSGLDTSPVNSDDIQLPGEENISGIEDETERIGAESRPVDNVVIMNAKAEDRATSFFAQPGILAAVIGGAVVGLLCAILVVMFIVYRMRKKDEGSYALDEPKRSPAAASYGKGHNNREFYA